MRPVVVTAVLLLVVLMSMSASAYSPGPMCKSKYPGTPCRKNIGEEGWSQFGQDRCVKAFLRSDGQRDAKKFCRSFRGGDLVSIHSLVEQSQVECAMYRTKNVKQFYWIGLQRRGKRFVWTDRSKYNYTFWAKRQPDNLWRKEKCVETNYGGWGFWNDASCKNKSNVVCQVRL